MGKIFYIADWHYGHSNVLHYDNRPFATVDEMNESLVERWNNAVTPEDTVYILGDMFWCKTTEAISVLDKLNGRKFLVKGNHDRCSDSQFAQRFIGIDDYVEIKDNEKNVVLCHYPIPCFKNHFYEWIHLYGHVHNSFEAQMMEHDKFLMKELYSAPCNMFNVGAMMPYIDYTPRTLDEIINNNR